MLNLNSMSFFCEITVVAAFTVANKRDKRNFPGVFVVLFLGITIGVGSTMAMVVTHFLFLS